MMTRSLTEAGDDYAILNKTAMPLRFAATIRRGRSGA